MCDQRLQVVMLAGIGESSTGTNGSVCLKRIVNRLVGVEPPHLMPITR